MSKVSNNRYNVGKKRKQSTKVAELREEDEFDDEDDLRSEFGKRGSKQIYWKDSNLTNFMILEDISSSIKWPIPKIRIDFRNVFVNDWMRSFLVKDLENQERIQNNFPDFAFEFQNTFYTKLLYSGLFNNIYCTFSQPTQSSELRLRFSSDSFDTFKLRPIQLNKSSNHRFIRAGSFVELHGVFGFCERFSYKANIALLFDNQMRHQAKYVLSIPFLGEAGSVRLSKGVMKRRINSELQCKRRRQKVTFYPFQWQNMCLSLSQNRFTSSHFEAYDPNSDQARIYYLSFNYGINKIFRNKHMRTAFNKVNDMAFLNNRLNEKQYSNQIEAKAVYTIPEQRFQIRKNALLKYQYTLQNKVFVGTHIGFSSKLQAKCTYFKKKSFLLTSEVETGMMSQFSTIEPARTLDSLEGSSLDSSSGFGVTMPWINNFEIHNVPGYYQLYRDNSNLSFYFTLRNKCYSRKINFLGFKPYSHWNFYYGSGNSTPVLNMGVGVSRHFDFLDSKVDFLVSTPNLFKIPWQKDPELAQFQIIFNS